MVKHVAEMSPVNQTINESMNTGEDLMKKSKGRKSIIRYIIETYTGTILTLYFTSLVSGGKQIYKPIGIRIWEYVEVVR